MGSKKRHFSASWREKRLLRGTVVAPDMPVCLTANDSNCIVRGTGKFGVCRVGIGLDLQRNEGIARRELGRAASAGRNVNNKKRIDGSQQDWIFSIDLRAFLRRILAT